MGESVAREMGISDARANMTEVIAEVRLLGQPVVLTRREKPQAVLVSVEFYEGAKTAGRIRDAALKALGEVPEPQRTPAMRRLGELLNRPTSS